jgi:hypothetical protein
MSWLYSQALVEEFLGDTFSDGEPSVQLSGNPTQLAYLSQDKMTAFSRLSRFGMTYKPLTESRGKELLTLYLEAFHAKTYPAQERAQALTESEAECGEKWRASFTKYDPDMRLWKTHQCSLLGDLEPYSETWPQWGLMRDGECWEQRMLEQTIRGTESGLSPTPTTQGLNGGSNSRKSAMRKGTWPTPTAHNAKETNAPSESERNTPTLAAQAGGQLNPTWVEWLMGWPLGWTDLKPLEMDKSPCVQQQHLNI